MINTKERAGFTLLEVLVASSILILATGAVLTLGRASIRSHDLAIERTEAYQLIQEGLEIVRQMRDTSFVDEEINSWDSSFPSGSGPFAVSWDPNVQKWVMAGGSEQITINGLVFTRSITISPAFNDALPATDEQGTTVPDLYLSNAKRFTITATWDSLGTTHEVSTTTLLTNWKGSA